MDFIAGQWLSPRTPDGELENRSPANLSAVLSRHAWAVSQVDAAVAAARQAFDAEPRAQLVRDIGAVLKKREEELARAIALDVGKPLWEARTEAQACSAKAAITASEGMKLVSGFPAPGQGGAECRFRPLGVLAVLGPFNFPVHLPNGHILPALACGNAVVFKPSEIRPRRGGVRALPRGGRRPARAVQPGAGRAGGGRGARAARGRGRRALHRELGRRAGNRASGARPGEDARAGDGRKERGLVLD